MGNLSLYIIYQIFKWVEFILSHVLPVKFVISYLDSVHCLRTNRCNRWNFFSSFSVRDFLCQCTVCKHRVSMCVRRHRLPALTADLHVLVISILEPRLWSWLCHGGGGLVGSGWHSDGGEELWVYLHCVSPAAHCLSFPQCAHTRSAEG